MHVIKELQLRLQEEGDAETARDQEKYMRNKFAFFGCKSPVWKGIAKDLIRDKGVFTGDSLQQFVRLCFEDPHREMQYAALLMLERRTKKEEIDLIEFLEECILAKSWWDTVDWISKFVGWHFLRFPKLQYPTCDKWMESGEMWLQRVAIIHQLTYREKTDEKLLFDMILRVADSKEFFLQKASGWALRQYSKVNPDAVRAFISSHQLSPLTVREGLRVIKKGKE